jgi:hypothetical protein
LAGCGPASIAGNSEYLLCLVPRCPVDQGAASVVAIFAGAASEVVLLGGRYNRLEAEEDGELARAELARCGFADAQPLWDHALDLVRANVSLIIWVAVHLEHFSTLDAAFLDKTVREWPR